MRRKSILFTILTLAVSSLATNPAIASTNNCGAGGTFTITEQRVTEVSADCAGEVSIPEGVTYFDPDVFSYHMITEMNIPSTYSSWDTHSAFGSLPALERITVSDANPNFSSDSVGILFNKDKTSLLFYPQGKTATSYEIPWGVEKIESAAFHSAQFTSVKIPSTVNSIGVAAFYGSRLTSVVIPASVTTLRYYAFRNNASLSTVTFAGDPPGPNYENYVFMDVTATVRVSQWQATAWAAKLAEYADEWTNLTLSGGYIYNFYNNGAVGQEPVPQWLSILESDFVTPTTSATRAGYTFTGWNTQPDKSGKSYLPGVSYTNSGDVNLYAQWTANLNTVTFDSKGGTSVSAGSFKTAGYVRAPADPSRDGYTFAGWSLTDGGSAITFPYSPTATGDITLYAKWTQNPTKAVAMVTPSLTGKAIATTKGTNKITAIKGTWTGYPTPAISYQWYSCAAQVKSAKSNIPKSCKKISHATTSTLKLTNTFKGKFIAVAVTGKGAGTSATQWLSKSTAKVK